jgi:hypothetical protein
MTTKARHQFQAPITHTTSLIATTQHLTLVDDEYNNFIVSSRITKIHDLTKARHITAHRHHSKNGGIYVSLHVPPYSHVQTASPLHALLVLLSISFSRFTISHASFRSLVPSYYSGNSGGCAQRDSTRLDSTRLRPTPLHSSANLDSPLHSLYTPIAHPSLNHTHQPLPGIPNFNNCFPSTPRAFLFTITH